MRHHYVPMCYVFFLLFRHVTLSTLLMLAESLQLISLAPLTQSLLSRYFGVRVSESSFFLLVKRFPIYGKFFGVVIFRYFQTMLALWELQCSGNSVIASMEKNICGSPKLTSLASNHKGFSTLVI